MEIRLCISGEKFDSIDFLLKVRNIPREYLLWDDKDLFEDDEGVTLDFGNDLKSAIKELLKFVLSNRTFLKNYKEAKKISIDVKLENNILQPNELPKGFWIISPKLLKVLAYLNIECYFYFE